MPAWGSCGRIIAQEKADFFEFMVRFAEFLPLFCSHSSAGMQHGVCGHWATNLAVAITANGL